MNKYHFLLIYFVLASLTNIIVNGQMDSGKAIQENTLVDYQLADENPTSDQSSGHKLDGVSHVLLLAVITILILTKLISSQTTITKRRGMMTPIFYGSNYVINSPDN